MKVRNLAQGLPLLAVLTPGAAWCLGLGDITVSTALNQPLRADIGVLSAEPDIENMRASLASQQVFDRVGIQRPFELTQLRFNIVPASDGGATIQVTTREPVREPFLNFLIEMRWPNGRLVREYTVLLDPPVLMDEQGVVIGNAPVAPREAGRAQAATGSASVADNRRAASSSPSARANAVSSQPAPASVTPASHTVVFGDTLYKIAQLYRPDESIRLSRMMVAIYRANPEAFAQGNLNGLQAGMILRMPDAPEIAGVDSEAAVAEVARNNAAWSESSEPIPSESVVDESSAQAEESIGQQPSTVDTMATEAKDSPAQANDNPGRLKIAAASEGSAAADGEGAIDTAEPRPRSDAETEQLLAREAAESRQVEIDSMQTRVVELESMIAKQARVISLQSEALADLQARLGANGADAAQSDGGARQAGVVTEADTQVQPDAPADDAQASTGTASGAPDRAAMDEPVAPPAAPDTLNALLANPVMLIGAGAAGLLLLALIWLVVKRAASRTQTIDLASFVDDDGDRDQATAIDASAGAIEPAKAATAVRAHAPKEAVNEESTNMPSANQSGGHASEQPGATGNDDTLAEADVYIAYGMHQQGEDLLIEAIARNPERIDYRLKLLEIYYAGRKFRPAERHPRPT